jgi:hypothetical protein
MMTRTRWCRPVRIGWRGLTMAMASVVCAAGIAVEASAPLEGEQERPPGADVISFASFGPLDTDIRGRSAAGGDAFRETQVREISSRCVGTAR